MGEHRLWKDFVRPELDALNEPIQSPDPATEGYVTFDPTKSSQHGDVTIGFDAKTGAITKLVRS